MQIYYDLFTLRSRRTMGDNRQSSSLIMQVVRSQGTLNSTMLRWYFFFQIITIFYYCAILLGKQKEGVSKYKHKSQATRSHTTNLLRKQKWSETLIFDDIWMCVMQNRANNIQHNLSNAVVEFAPPQIRWPVTSIVSCRRPCVRPNISRGTSHPPRASPSCLPSSLCWSDAPRLG